MFSQIVPDISILYFELTHYRGAQCDNPGRQAGIQFERLPRRFVFDKLRLTTPRNDIRNQICTLLRLRIEYLEQGSLNSVDNLDWLYYLP